VDYLTDRTHHTILNSELSGKAHISAGVIQGSVLGPTLFNVTSSTLTPLSSLNSYFKYADDGYLVVPGSNAASIPQELLHHSQWTSKHNLKLNLSKTSEIIFTSKRSKVSTHPPTPGVVRVSSLKILGVLFDDKLSFQFHVTETIKSFSQALFALRTLRHHGLSNDSLYLTFSAKILSKVTYGSPAWWGFIAESSKAQLEAYLRKAKKVQLLPYHRSYLLPDR
jgi:hypothetical protein